MTEQEKQTEIRLTKKMLEAIEWELRCDRSLRRLKEYYEDILKNPIEDNPLTRDIYGSE